MEIFLVVQFVCFMDAKSRDAKLPKASAMAVCSEFSQKLTQLLGGLFDRNKMEVFNLFSYVIALEVLSYLESGRKPQGLVPEFKITEPLNQAEHTHRFCYLN